MDRRRRSSALRAQVFLLYERCARTPLWRRFKARLVDGKGFGASAADSFDEELPYYRGA